MARGYFIREGDKTTCGGVVIAGDGRTNMMGFNHAREGDPVTCGVDGKAYIIVGGIGFIDSNGRSPAGTLDSSSTCPCRARLINSLSHSYEKQDKPSAQRATQPDKRSAPKPQMADSASPTHAPKAEIYARSFAITNSETGQPLANRKFIAVVNGHEKSGITDAAGMAHIKTSSADSIVALHVVFNAPARELSELSRIVQ
ncbi:PAAR domain-containing protein [Pseudomonas folii]|uniref:PAAR domain-containing protein n=1 Tax=Pseudomonas folii TaxID=2762593 RepID=A0ABR7B825_9PSED|nr:PAAR domain-containing protein [Pseudomonas folii]MBC3953328.1 PAAR domain-containing protein [Pseudomonas folii]